MEKKFITKLICMFLCLCLLLPMFSSCFESCSDDPTDDSSDNGGNEPTPEVPGGEDPAPDDPGSGDTPSDDPTPDEPGGDTQTTYYKVSFAVAIEEYKNRVTLPEEKLYKAGTEIQYLPTPAVRDLLFVGWYYDAAMTKPVSLTDKVSSDIMLYAKVVDTADDISVVEGVYYHTAYDVNTDYVFSLKADSIDEVKTNLGIVNVSSAGAPLTLGEDYTVADNGNGSFSVSVAYKPGKTYRASIASGSELSFIVDGNTLDEQVTTLNVLVAKTEVSNITLSGGIIYIPASDVEMLTDTPNGLVAVGESGATVNSGSVGYFSYDGASLKSGDRVAVYEGDIPTERDFATNNGSVKYLTVTGDMGNNIYKFRVSDSEEVLFVPDIFPVSGKTNVEQEAKITIDSFDFGSDLYKQLGMDEDTTVDVGDYVVFYDGPMADGTPVEYARITSVQRDNKYYYISYTPASYDDVIASMDIYHTRTETPELSEPQVETIKQQVYDDAMNSGFLDEAAAYLVDLYMSTDGLSTLDGGNSGARALVASGGVTSVESSLSTLSLSKSTPGAVLTESRSGGLYYEITKCEAEPDIKVGEGVLKHFEESDGIRVELILSFEVEFTIGEDGENKVVIAAEAVFEEEILLTINVDGGAVWETAWIFPYVVDYEMNANIDIGTYTGVSVIAKVYTSNGEEKEEEEEDDDSFFPDFDLDNIGKGDSYDEKAKNIGEELKKLFELNDNIKEEVEGEEEEDDTGNDITEKYAEMMKDANESWIEIVRTEIYKQSTNIDTLGILWFDIGIDFVVSAQLYIMAGIEVETGVAKRYNFSVTLFERSVKTDVIDLEKAHFSFKFYCMGTAGLKVGFEVELSLALLSSDVSSVGISAELGVSLGIWGYFYYSYEKEAGEEPEIQKAGAMFFELGIYIEVKFKAHLFNIEKLTYNPTLYENLWPIYSVGSQENVFEFEDYTDRELTFTMQGTNSIVLPDYIFRMKYLDLKDGKYYSGKGSDDETPSKTLDDDTESRFLIEISDSRFSYNPKTNTLSTTVDVKNMDVEDSFEIKIKITYKHGALAFNQEVITREITVQVKNNADYGYVYVWLNGPSYLNAVGPKGSHTYALKHGEEFTVDMLPKYDFKDGYKFVKWIWMQNYRDVNDKLWVEGDEFVGLVSMERRTHIYLTAVWEPQNVDCTLRIFKESVGGTYVFDKTQTITGLIKTSCNLSSVLRESGYVLRAGSAQYVDFEYQASYDVYLERATKTIRYLNVDGEGGEIVTTAKVGSVLVPPVVSSRLGYNFVGWASGASQKLEPCVMPETVPNVSYGTMSYTALWEPVSDVPYTVKHYVQNANDDGYELYMTEYLTASYDDPLRVWNHFSSAVTNAGFTFTSAVNPDYNTVYRVALDGSTTLRIYYTRDVYEVYNYTYSATNGNTRTRYSLGFYRHGQTVDLSACDVIPSKAGYRFVGWDANRDGTSDDSFIMPQKNFEIEWIQEATDDTEYKVIHMVQDAETDNYVQAGVTAMYGVTGTIPNREDIYSDKYVIEGQFVPNYAKAKVSKITPGTPATMYAYYDRVDYKVMIKAYHPETNALVSTTAYSLPYGKTIKLSTDRSYLSHFDVEGYQASRLASPGYTEMPAHDIEINVVYTPEDSIPFIVNHFCENTIGGFELYQSIVHTGRAGTALHDIYRQYVLSELDGSGFSVSTERIVETYVAGRGYTMFNIYYVRDKVTITGNIYKLDLEGNVVESVPYTNRYRLDETVNLDLYYDDNYVFERRESRTEGDTYTALNRTYNATKDMVMDIYVKPSSSVPYTVTHWVENIDGTGYEIYATYNYTGSHTATVSSQYYVRNWAGFEVDPEHYESIVLDGSVKNNLNVYYTRTVYDVTFYNTKVTGSVVTYQVKHGATIPAPTTDTYAPGYTFVGWKGYTEGDVAISDVIIYSIYEFATDTPYTVNHYLMGLDGNYTLALSEQRTGSTNSWVYAHDHLSSEYDGNGYSFAEDACAKIAPDGSTVLSVYYERQSFRFKYNYYVGGKVVDSFGELLMLGAPIPDSFYDYEEDYPAYELDGYSILKNGEYVSISELPTVMGNEDIEIRVTLKAIGPEVTIVHKVMNTDGETYTETRETFLTIPFEELDLTYHLLSSVQVGFTYRIPVNNQVPDALKENVYEIYYDRNTYTVKYVSDYTLDSITESYLYGASIGESPVFKRPGYTQSGWNAEIPETMPARDLTFTTTWQIREAVPVTVVHMMSALDGNGYVEKHRQVVTHVPELTIYGSNYAIVLLGGTYKSADKAIVAEDGSTEVCVYYSRNEYTVRFTYGDIAGAGEDVVVTLPYESVLTAPDFKVTGYELVGWYPDFTGSMPADNVTYTAKWSAEAVNVTVKHWIEGLDGSNSVSATESVSAKADSVISGASYVKTFEGFTYDDADKNVTVSSDGSTVVNVYYTRNSYKVIYTYGNMSGNAVEHTVKYGASLPSAPEFSVVGYDFDGWDGTIATAMPAHDLTYAARWKASENTAFTVEHYYQNANDDGYTKVYTEEKRGTTNATVNGEDHKKSLPEAIFEKSESKTVNADGSTVIEVYYVRTTYTLTFTYGDKTGESAVYTLRYGQSVSHNPAFSVQGYVFDSWDKEIPSTMPAENVIVNAKWTAGSGVEYKVEHYVQNANDDDYKLEMTDNRSGITGAMINGSDLATLVGGGIVLKSAQSKAIAADGSTVIKIYYDRASFKVTYTYGDKSGESVVHTVRYGATLPASPVLSTAGYTFDGWDKAIATVMPATDLVYSAKWTANTDTEYTVEHYYQNANDDGYTVAHREYKEGTTGTTVNGIDHKITLEEAVFERAENGIISADGKAVIKLYYARTTYNVTFSYGFVANNEKVYSVRYGATLPEIPVFSAVGYTFDGWMDEEGLSCDIVEEMPANDLVYTARWMAKEDTSFKVEHYVEQADGTGYDLVKFENSSGRTGSEIDDIYLYVLSAYDDGETYFYERSNDDGFTILPDGSAVLKIYYQRVRYTVTFYVVDHNENTIDGIDFISVDFKYGQTVTPPSVAVLEGYEFAGYVTDHEIMPALAIEYYIVWQCLHLSVDSGHTCEICYDTLECIDSNDDGHCDYGREPMDPDDHRYVDNDNDHICDICYGTFTDLCFDDNNNGKCDVCDLATLCPETDEDHVDEDGNHFCDDCGVWLSYKCNIYEGSHTCWHCGQTFYELCSDENKDCICDECNNQMLCVDKDGDLVCDVCGNDMPCLGHVDENEDAVCDYCDAPTWCVDFDDTHRDNNYDHTCDNCGIWMSFDCIDDNEDGRCDECYRAAYCKEEYGKAHTDADGDHYCDECERWMSYECVDEYKDWVCDICDNELTCFDHVDENKNAFCDICGKETKCKNNPNDSAHADDDWDHTCDYCDVRMPLACYDDDYDGYCDEPSCGKEFICEHLDEDKDNYCDRCNRIINCTHENVSDHFCTDCFERMTDCYSEDGDIWCDECGEQVECEHVGMEGEHVCHDCYEYLSDCVDEDGDGKCDLSPHFPHSPSERS